MTASLITTAAARRFADRLLEALGDAHAALATVGQRFPGAEVSAGLEPDALDQADPARLPEIVFELAYAGESFTGTFPTEATVGQAVTLMSTVLEAMRAEVEDFTPGGPR